MVYWPPWSVKKALFLGMGWLWDVSFAPSSLGKRSHDLNHHWFPEVVSLCLFGKGKQTPTSWPEHSVNYAQVKTRRVSCHDLRVENVESCRRKSLHLRESVEGTVSVLGTTKPTNEVRRSLLVGDAYHITRCRRRLWSHGWAVSFREARFSFFIIIQLGPLAIQPPKTQPQPQNISDKLAFYAGLQWCACLKWHSSAIKMTPFLAAARPVWQWQCFFQVKGLKNDRYFITNLANWAICQLNLMCLLGLQYDFWALLLGVLTMSTVFFPMFRKSTDWANLGMLTPPSNSHVTRIFGQRSQPLQWKMPWSLI